MKARTWSFLGIGAAVVIVVGAIVVNQLPGRNAATVGAGGSPAVSLSSSPAPSTRATTKPGTGSHTPTPDGDESGTPQSKRFTTEVIPGSGASKLLPQSTALPEPVSNPLPKSASAVGALATGYPSTLLPAAPNSSITSSSVASQGAHLQVSLTAKSSLAIPDILAFYRTALAKYGMYDTASPALGGATAQTFKRGVDSVTVSATPVEGGTKYIIFGAFTAKS